MQPASNHNSSHLRDKHRNWRAFALCVLCVVAIWFGVLPQVATIPAVERRIEQFEAAGINPGTMYYSELEMMPRVISELNARERTHPRLLWSLRFAKEPETGGD